MTFRDSLSQYSDYWRNFYSDVGMLRVYLRWCYFVSVVHWCIIGLIGSNCVDCHCNFSSNRSKDIVKVVLVNLIRNFVDQSISVDEVAT